MLMDKASGFGGIWEITSQNICNLATATVFYFGYYYLPPFSGSLCDYPGL